MTWLSRNHAIEGGDRFTRRRGENSDNWLASWAVTVW